jgi:transcriptional regulator with XRE-family HTH domain
MPFHGERLKWAREKKGLNQRDLAKLTGMSEPQLSRYEHDKQFPSADGLETLARQLEIPVDFLLGLTDDPLVQYTGTELSIEEFNVINTLRRDGWIGLLRLVTERLEKLTRRET